MKRLKLFNLGFLATLLMVSTGYAIARSGEVEEEFHQTYALSSGGSVSVNNVNGDLKIVVWDKKDVKVDAVKYADDEETLSHLKIVVDAGNDLVDIDTIYPKNGDNRGGNGARVDYIITVPKDANLKRIKTVNGEIEISDVAGNVQANTVNGTIHASSLKGDCELRTVNGNIDAGFGSVKSGAEITLNTVNGSLAISLPDKVSARVKASANTGRITNDFGLTSSRDHSEHSFVKVGDSIDGAIGNGDATIRIGTVNGSIQITKSGTDK